MALQNFGGGFTEAQYILNFLGIPVSKSFLRKKIHDIELFLETMQEKIKEESLYYKILILYSVFQFRTNLKKILKKVHKGL